MSKRIPILVATLILCSLIHAQCEGMDEQIPSPGQPCDCFKELHQYNWNGETIFFGIAECNGFDWIDAYFDCEGEIICNDVAIGGEPCPGGFLNEIEFVEVYWTCEQEDPCDWEPVINAEYINCIGTDDVPQSTASESWCFTTSYEGELETDWILPDGDTITSPELCYDFYTLQNGEVQNPDIEICAEIEYELCTYSKCYELILLAECGGVCIDESLIDFEMDCDDDAWNPVCACDGLVYQSVCNAEFYHGIAGFTWGVCDEIQDPGFACGVQSSVAVISGDTTTICFDELCDGAYNFVYAETAETSNNAVPENNCIVFSHSDGFLGADLITAYYCNASGLCAETQIEVMVELLPVIVVAVNDTFEGFSSPDEEYLPEEMLVLENDSILNTEEAPVINVLSQPETGVVSVVDGGLFCDDCTGGSWGDRESFIYEICIGEVCDQATVFFYTLYAGIEEWEGSLDIYPNPATDFIEVNSDGEPINAISIYDLHGRTILMERWNDRMTNRILNLPDVSSGVYFLEIRSDDRAVNHKIQINQKSMTH